MNGEQDIFFMQRAFELAKQGAAAGEVPVGAVLVLNDEIIAERYNAPIALSDPSAHAEILALRAGAITLNNYRLLNTTLYVTLEPCMMCAGAMIHSRIQRLVYAASDAKAGAVASRLQLLDQPFINHKIQHDGGVMQVECGQLLSDFFKSRR